MITVTADVVYQGDTETLQGTYTLVIWENSTDPILNGRELQGIPKVYADIPDHQISRGQWSVNASHYGNTIINLSVSDLKAPSLEEIALLKAAKEGKDNPMGWRYLQSLGDEPISEYTIFPSENHLKQLQVGKGELSWNPLTWEQNPTQYHIVNALKDLPILEWRPALMTRGATNLLVPGSLPRKLR